MNNPEAADTAKNEMMTAMFASLIMQQTNMATIFLGLAPNPQTGQKECDLDHAKYFIDQLEMLEAKTRGNLDQREQALLNQSLTNLRLAFVEVVSHAAEAPAEAKPEEPPPAPPAQAAAESAEPAAPKPEETGAAPAAPESHKKFTKKY
jgi:hypothetical protein